MFRFWTQICVALLQSKFLILTGRSTFESRSSCLPFFNFVTLHVSIGCPELSIRLQMADTDANDADDDNDDDDDDDADNDDSSK